MQTRGRHSHYHLGTTVHWPDSDTGASITSTGGVFPVMENLKGGFPRDGHLGQASEGGQTSTGHHPAGRENSETRCCRRKTPGRRPMRSRLSGHVESRTLTVFMSHSGSDPCLWSEGVESIFPKAFPALTFCGLSLNCGSKVRTQDLR